MARYVCLCEDMLASHPGNELLLGNARHLHRPGSRKKQFAVCWFIAPPKGLHRKNMHLQHDATVLLYAVYTGLVLADS